MMFPTLHGGRQGQWKENAGCAKLATFSASVSEMDEQGGIRESDAQYGRPRQ